jgi:hypothetical protein
MAARQLSNRSKFFWNISHHGDLYMGPAAIPPPPRVAGQCEAQRVFCSLRLISLLDLAGNAQLGRDRKQKRKAAGAPALARQGCLTLAEARQKGDVGRQLARFFR